MGKHGKIGSLDRWKEREARGIKTALQALSQTIQVGPLKDGRISVQLGPPGGMGISFLISQKIVLDAAQAGMIFAEELQKKATENAGAAPTTQPVGGQ